MSDILNEAYDIMQCKECPWYKACATPMRFTTEEITRQMQASNLNAGNQLNPESQQIMASMAEAAQKVLLEACPILVERLRSNPKLAERIKQMMQNWSED
jgi:hypothetical protein